MIRRLLVQVCSTAEHVLSSTLSANEVKAILLGSYRQLAALPREQWSPAARADMATIAGHLASLGWVKSAVEPAASSNADAVRHASDWRGTLPAKGVLSGIGFSAGCGAHLDLLHAYGSEEERRFALEQAERLLRHVEVKRQHALSRSEPELAARQLTMEKWDVAILFARIAMRERDLRFLNAAFKMNDWSLKKHPRPGRLGIESRLRFLLSLAEQEAASGALL